MSYGKTQAINLIMKNKFRGKPADELIPGRPRQHRGQPGSPRRMITNIETSRSSKNILGIRVATFDDTPPLSESSGGNQNELQTH